LRIVWGLAIGIDGWIQTYPRRKEQQRSREYLSK
jgi:hypothetical protein